ncbi:MAG: hypothetical protein ACI82H_001867 [Alphaproteobacteria bacterium]|jgi:hypothetical protein
MADKSKKTGNDRATRKAPSDSRLINEIDSAAGRLLSTIGPDKSGAASLGRTGARCGRGNRNLPRRTISADRLSREPNADRRINRTV